METPLDCRNNTRLKIKTFGYTDIMYGGKTIFRSNQNTARIKSILQYFILKKNQLCIPEEIVEDLWPDNEYVNGKKAVQTYIYRLKNIISKENVFNMDFSNYISITNVKGAYRMIVSEETVLDTDVFMEIVNRSREELTLEERMDTACRLIQVYSGHYMQDSLHDRFVLRMRNYYLQTCCNTIHDLMNSLFEAQRYHDVIKIAEDFQAIDDINEEINLIFLKALINTRQSNYAVRHFKYIEKKMQEELGISPDDELYALLQIGRSKPRENASGTKEEQKDDNRVIEEAQLKNLIEEIINEKLFTAKTNNTFVLMEVVGIPGKNVAGDLETVLLHSLRKNDMYAVTDEKIALIMLFDAKTEHLESIRKRLEGYCASVYSAKVQVKTTMLNAKRIM